MASIEITSEQIGTALAYTAGGAAAAISALHTLKRFVGQKWFQLSAGDAIKMSTAVTEEQKKVLTEIHDHMQQEKENFKRLLKYQEETAKIQNEVVVLLRTMVNRPLK